MDKVSFIYYKVDTDTGEVFEIDNTVLEVEPGTHARLITDEQIKHVIRKSAAREDRREFVWLLFKYGRPLQIGVSNANLTRLICLASYSMENGIIMHKNDVKDTLELNKNQWSDFWREATASNVLREKDGVVHINPKYFRLGQMNARSDYTRIYTYYYRELYDTLKKAQDFNAIHYVIQMIPFLNRKTNILAFNNEEQDETKLLYMHFSDFCKRINYDASHISRLKKQLLKYRINDELIVGFFDNIQVLSAEGENVVVNPKLFFGGLTYSNIYKSILSAFEKEKYQHLNCDQSTPC